MPKSPTEIKKQDSQPAEPGAQNPFLGPMFEQKVVGTVLTERDKYERNSNVLRETIRKAYRNFLSIFDDPFTKYTKRQKNFFALTQYHVLSSASKVYVDPRAITILPVGEDDLDKAKIWNMLVPFQLKQIGFFQAMNSFSVDLALFGTVVSSQEWEFKKEVYVESGAEDTTRPTVTKETITQDTVCYKFIPILNCYIDPTAESIQTAPAFLISSWVEVADLPALKAKYKWSGDVTGIDGVKLITTGAHKDDRTLIRYAQQGVTQREMEIPMVELLYRYAKVPLSWVTKKESDSKIWVETKITILNGNAGRKQIEPDRVRLLDISLNPYKHGKRPFEECWYIKVPRRWYGLGVGEMMIDPNAYLNRIMNQRIDNNEILQNKMFKARRNSGLDNKSIASAPGKVVTVQNIDDLQVLETGDSKSSSYNDEQNILQWAERLSHIKDMASNSKTATEASIDESVAGEFFAIVRRNINDYLRRVIQQFIQLDMQYIEQDFMIRVTGQTEDFASIDAAMGIPDEARAGLGNFRFVKVSDIGDIRGDFDIEVDIDNSVPINKALMLQGIEKLVTLSMQDPNSGLNRAELYKEWVQAMGFKGSRFFLNPSQTTVPLPGQQPMGQQMPPQGVQTVPTPGVPTNAGGIAANLGTNPTY